MSANAQLRKRREAAKSRYAPKPKPQKIIAQGTDPKFLNELRSELKA